MREIKFRAWNGSNMFYADTKQFGFQFRGDGDWAYCDFGAECVYASSPKAGILMLYTGLRDDNGKEICEADIVSAMLKNEYGSLEKVVGEVVYIEGIAMFNLMVNWQEGRLGFEFYRLRDMEVIGNIYENPHLIK